MATTFCALLAAYLLGDVVFRPVQGTRTAKIRNVAVRAIAMTCLACLLLGTSHWPVPLAILLALFAANAVKVCLSSDSVALFLAGEYSPFVVLWALAFWLPDTAQNGWWARA